jgi:hypothetical protein
VTAEAAHADVGGDEVLPEVPRLCATGPAGQKRIRVPKLTRDDFKISMKTWT